MQNFLFDNIETKIKKSNDVKLFIYNFYQSELMESHWDYIQLFPVDPNAKIAAFAKFLKNVQKSLLEEGFSENEIRYAATVLVVTRQTPTKDNIRKNIEDIRMGFYKDILSRYYSEFGESELDKLSRELESMFDDL